MEVFDLSAVLRLDKKAFEAGLASASTAASKFSGIAKSAIGAVTATIRAAAKAVTAFAVNSVKVGMNFDKSMSQVAATMGKTVDEIQDLREFAKEMGRKTSFSASQAADALNYMALAGYDAQKSMRMLPNVLNLAASGGMDLARASDMVTDASSALGLKEEQTTALIDQMAKAASKTNTSVSQLGEAILTVGGTAKIMKGGTVELSTALGVLADNGIKGAEGGTALRNILMSMSSGKFKNVFGELGVSAYDATGKMRDMNEILSEMNRVMSSMTDEQKTKIISKAFNKYDLKSVNALLGTTSQRWNEVSEAIENSAGSSAKMAETQLDNLSGSLTKFKSALEGAQIAISDKLSPTLNEFVKFGTDSISKLTDAFEKNGISGAMQTLGDIIVDGVSRIIESLPQIVSAVGNSIGAIVSGISKNLPKIIGVISSLFKIVFNELGKYWPQFANAGWEMLKAIYQGVVDNIDTLIDAAMEALSGLASYMNENIGVLTEGVIKILTAIVSGISNMLPTLVPAAVEIITTLSTTLIDNLPEILDVGIMLIDKLANTLIDSMPQLTESALKIIDKLITFVTDPQNLAKILEMSVKLIIAVATGLLAAVPKLLVGIGKIIANVVDTVIHTDWGELGQKLMENISQALQNAWGKLAEWWEEWSAEIGKWATIAWDSVVETWSKVGNWFGDRWNDIASAFQNVGQWFGNVFTIAWDSVVETWSKVGDWFGDRWNDIASAFQNVGQWFGNVFTIAWDAVKSVFTNSGEFFSKVWEGIKNAFSAVTGWFSDIFGKAWEAIKNVFAPVGSVFQNIGDSILNGLKSIVNGLIWGINQIISIPFDGLNAVLNGMKGINIFGLKPFDWIPNIGVPQIPYLAEGGVLKKGQVALLEGQGDEAVIPLSQNTEWIDKVADRLNKSSEPQNIYYTINIDVASMNANSQQDIENLADMLMSVMAEKTARKGAAW